MTDGDRSAPKRRPGRPVKGSVVVSPRKGKSGARAPKDKVRDIQLRREKVPDIDPIRAALPVKELFTPWRDRAAKTIANLALHSRSDEMRLAASRYILDRTDGPIPKPMEISGKDGAPLAVQDDRPSLSVMLGLAIGQAVTRDTVREAIEAAGRTRTIQGDADDDGGC